MDAMKGTCMDEYSNSCRRQSGSALWLPQGGKLHQAGPVSSELTLGSHSGSHSLHRTAGCSLRAFIKGPLRNHPRLAMRQLTRSDLAKFDIKGGWLLG